MSERMGVQKGVATMVFRGEVLSVAALLDAARTTADIATSSSVELRHTAAQNAAACRDLLVGGDSTDACWQFGILQTLDDYSSSFRRGGVDLACEVFTDEPPNTGAAEVDAAFAALAEYLAERDGWVAPNWVQDPTRRTEIWYPAVPAIFHVDADRESPDAFRSRGIMITSNSLARA